MVWEKLWPDVKMIDSLLFWIFSEKKGIGVGLHFSLLVFTEEKTESKSYFLVTGCLTQLYVHSTTSCPWSPGLVLRRTYHLNHIIFSFCSKIVQPTESCRATKNWLQPNPILWRGVGRSWQLGLCCWRRADYKIALLLLDLYVSKEWCLVFLRQVAIDISFISLAMQRDPFLEKSWPEGHWTSAAWPPGRSQW